MLKIIMARVLRHQTQENAHFNMKKGAPNHPGKWAMPNYKKIRKGLPFFCFPIDSIKQINLQRFSVVQGTMTQTFFNALHLTPIEENKAEPNICGIEEQNLEPYSHTK